MRDVVFPSDKQANYEAYGYSAAVRSGGFLFVSGQVGVDASGRAIKDPAGQFQMAFTNLGGVLAAAECGFDDIVDITTFHVDMYDHFDAFAAAKQTVFPNPPFPNWTAIGVVNLADPELLLEIKVIAKLAEVTWLLGYSDRSRSALSQHPLKWVQTRHAPDRTRRPHPFFNGTP